MSAIEIGVNKTCTVIFEQLSLTGNLVSGQAGNITKTLRNDDGAAPETVTITEQGSSGFYEATFTPLSGSDAGFPYYLRLQSPSPATDGALLTWEFRSFLSVVVSFSFGGMNLTTLDHLKEYLGITVSTYDGLLSNMIARMSRFLEVFWGRNVGARDYDEKRNGMGGADLVLRRDINTLTSLYQSLDQTWNSGTLISPANYLWDAETGIVHLKAGGFFWRGFRNVRAIYNAGLASIPGDIEEVAIRVLAREYLNRTNSSDWTSMSLKDGSIARRTASSIFSKEELLAINVGKDLSVSL